MSYFLQSIRTASYWKYAILSVDAVKTFFAVMGGGWTMIALLEFFHFIERVDFPKWMLWALFLLSVVVVVTTRRPLYKIVYKIPGKNIAIEVKIGNLFQVRGQKVISTNTTFDTDMATGIISPHSVQGQFTNKYYPQSIHKLDHEIEENLRGVPYTEVIKDMGKGKIRRYSMGTSVIFNIQQERFYWLAMANMNEHNTAETSIEYVMQALDKLWSEISTKGEKENIVLPLIGTGRGRLNVNRKKLIGDIAQSFVNASSERIFANKLTIVIHPSDVQSFDINLFQVRDLLVNYLG